MRLNIEARLVDDNTEPVEEGDRVMAVGERSDLVLAELRLTLAEGRSPLGKVKAELFP